MTEAHPWSNMRCMNIPNDCYIPGLDRHRNDPPWWMILILGFFLFGGAPIVAGLLLGYTFFPHNWPMIVVVMLLVMLGYGTD